MVFATRDRQNYIKQRLWGTEFLAIGRSRELQLKGIFNNGKHREIVLFHSRWPLLGVWPFFRLSL